MGRPRRLSEHLSGHAASCEVQPQSYIYISVHSKTSFSSITPRYKQNVMLTVKEQFSLDCSMAVIGWLMFGESVRDEITANVFLTPEYPRGLSISMIIFIAIIPITKVPLK